MRWNQVFAKDFMSRSGPIIRPNLKKRAILASSSETDPLSRRQGKETGASAIRPAVLQCRPTIEAERHFCRELPHHNPQRK